MAKTLVRLAAGAIVCAAAGAAWLPPSSPAMNLRSRRVCLRERATVRNAEEGRARAPNESRQEEGKGQSGPCIRICRYKAHFFDAQVCIGCFRDSHEIANWGRLSAQEREWALADADDRRQLWAAHNTRSDAGRQAPGPMHPGR